MFDPSGLQGAGWTGIPSIVTGPAGTTAGGMGPGAAYGAGGAMPGGTMGDGGNVGGGGGAHTSSPMMNAVMHPTSRQILFAVAIGLALYAWRAHLKSMLE